MSEKPIVKRDASGRTITQRFEKIESAVKQANASFRSSETGRYPSSKGEALRPSEKRK